MKTVITKDSKFVDFENHEGYGFAVITQDNQFPFRNEQELRQIAQALEAKICGNEIIGRFLVAGGKSFPIVKLEAPEFDEDGNRKEVS